MTADLLKLITGRLERALETEEPLARLGLLTLVEQDLACALEHARTEASLALVPKREPARQLQLET